MGENTSEQEQSAESQEELEAQEPEGNDPDGENSGAEGDTTESEDLGEKGKKALQAMKAKEQKARAELRTERQKLAALQAQIDAASKEPEEQKLDQAREEVRTQERQRGNERIKRSEIKAAATGRFANPSDVLNFVKLDDIEIDDDGEVDQDAVKEALDELLEKKPYLAAQGSTQKQFDSARGKRAPAGQVTREELQKMTPEQRLKAHNDGRTKDLLGK